MSSKDLEDTLLLASGATLLAVGLSDLHLRYVKASMQPLIVIAGVVLLVLAVAGYQRAAAQRPGEQAAESGHDDEGQAHAEGHRIGFTTWLLALPLLVLGVVTPPSLGAFAAARSETRIAEPTRAYAPLPQTPDGVVGLTFSDYYGRVLYDPGSLAGAVVRLTGFVVPAEGGRWYVARMSLACCAADGRPVKVLVTGDAARKAPPADSWVQVVGTYAEPEVIRKGRAPVGVLKVDSVTPVQAPRYPYED